jgi:hypothetical protein
MVWSKTDDKLHSHHKAKRALKGHDAKRRDAAPMGLWVMGQSYAGDNRTDGYVPLDELERWDDDPEVLAERLVVSGLWHPAARLADGTVLVLVDCESADCGAGLERTRPDDPRLTRLTDPGWLFHDWSQCNPLRVRIEADEQANRIRAELHRDTALKAAITRRDKDRCRYCGTAVNWRARRGPTAATYDHVKPIASGGTNVLDNVVTACQPCNERKGKRSLREAGMRLLKPGALGAPDVAEDGDASDPGPTQIRTEYAGKSAGVTGSARNGSGRVGSGSKNVPNTHQVDHTTDLTVEPFLRVSHIDLGDDEHEPSSATTTQTLDREEGR